MSGPPPRHVSGAMDLDPAYHMRAGIAEFQDAIQSVADKQIASLDAEFGPGQAAQSQHGVIINRKRGHDEVDYDSAGSTPRAKKQKQKAFYTWLGGLPRAIGPRAIKPRRVVTPRGFDLLSSLMGTTELAVEIVKHLPYKDFLTIYSVSPVVKNTFDAHLASSLKQIAEYQAPGSFSNFHWSKYPNLTIPDPMLRPKNPEIAIIPGRSDNFGSPTKLVSDASLARKVPSLRWLAMVGYRHRALSDIIATMAGVNLRLPRGGIDTLKKLWAFNEVGTTQARINLLADPIAFSNIDLYIINVFLKNLESWFEDDVHYPVPLVVFIGLYNGFGLLARYMRRETLQTMHHAMAYTLMYDETHVTDDMVEEGVHQYAQEVSGKFVLDRGHLEGFGTGQAHLMRIDEVMFAELDRRGHTLDGDPECQALWMDMTSMPDATELAVTTDNGPIIPRLPALQHRRDLDRPFMLRDCSPILAKRAVFRNLSPEEKMNVWKADSDAKLRALSEGHDDGFSTWTLQDVFEGEWFDELEAEEGFDVNDHNMMVDSPMEQYQAMGMGLFAPRHQSLICQAVRRVSDRAAMEYQYIEDEVDETVGYQPGDDPEWEAEFARQVLQNPVPQPAQQPAQQQVQQQVEEVADEDMGEDEPEVEGVGHGSEANNEADGSGANSSTAIVQQEPADDIMASNEADDEPQQNAGADSHTSGPTQTYKTIYDTTVSALAQLPGNQPNQNGDGNDNDAASNTEAPAEQQRAASPELMHDVTEMLHAMMVGKREAGQVNGRYGPQAMTQLVEIIHNGLPGINPTLLANAEREVLEGEERRPTSLAPALPR